VRYFPLYACVEGKQSVVVGGGPVAERKVADLLEAGALVRVVSPAITERLRQQAQAGEIEWLPAYYAPVHIEDAWLVFAATNDRAVNAQIALDANARRLFVNVVDGPEEGSFLVPSVVRRGDLCLSVSTGGANPMLARKVASELEMQYGDEYGLLVELLGQMRAYTKVRTSVPSLRRAALARLITQEAELRRLLLTGDEEGARARAKAVIEDALVADSPEPGPDRF
jgi:precorrin-2 dehydrogenase/sirohydrochlorin ferrochelatase